ncbi:MAG: glutamine--fructose-6-phosphate transaminase (isomerizing) [Anaerolineae bacterium]|nr:glutamine--fructose-6-phosphate transaminase (isomerizing) [Anaerolineae bacterium]
MCGIVGYTGARQAAPIIMEGLKRLEYRGYDSAGIAVLQPDGSIGVRRDVGKLGNLAARLGPDPLSGHYGLGHTRWATHGAPSERNSHPHRSTDGAIVVVHNGIVENFRELRAELQAEGVQFASETDTEVIVHLVALLAQPGVSLTEAVRQAACRLEGAQAIVVMSAHEPGRLVAVRIGNAGGVALGVGEGEMFVASDIPAILEHTRRIVFLESRQIATLDADGFRVQDLHGQPIHLVEHAIAWDPVSAAKGEYRHFMQKEIFEQARSLTDTLRGRINFETGEVTLGTLEISAEDAKKLKRLVTVACGTSAYAGLVGKFIIEGLARLPVEVDYGSEYRYRDPILDPDTAVLAITQSGETVDTLAAMEEASHKKARLWSIVNAIGSQAMRLADGYIAMQTGPEIGVASTKAFTASITDQYLLALYLAQQRGTISPAEQPAHARALAHLPELVSEVLERHAEIEALAGHLYHYTNFLYLGRGINYPIALEGALKLKEISYIHAEGYPAGEMKHGPIALIDEQMPVLAIATQDRVYEKMINQIEQAKARNGVVVAIGTQGDHALAEKADHVFYVPPSPEYLSPIVNVLPLQLLAYAIAVRRGCDVDQPRNLAKSVTVE